MVQPPLPRPCPRPQRCSSALPLPQRPPASAPESGIDSGEHRDLLIAGIRTTPALTTDQSGCTPAANPDASSQRWMGSGRPQRRQSPVPIAMWRVTPRATLAFWLQKL